MASYDEVKLEDILHGSFATFNPNTGANKDADSLPTLIVYEEGSSTALTVTSSVTNITTGRYRWQITIEASAGFETGKYYEVWISATVTGTDTVSQVAPVTSFKATARVVDDVSTLTQTQVTGGTYALNSASFAFNAALDFTTTQKAATLARVTLADTTTTLTNLPTIPANWLTAAGLAADAVAEIQSGLATATNVSDAQTAIITQVDANETKIDSIQSDTNDIQTRLPASLESGRIAAALDSASRVKLDASQPDYAPLLASGYTTPPTTGAIADAVLTESVLDHRNVANSLAKYIWQIRQANLTIDGTVSNAITPTTLTFASNVAATTSAYAHAVLLFTTGPLAGENSPIISYNSTNGVFLLEEALTAAPSSGDEFVVIAGSHVHSVADIQSGLASQASVNTLTSYVDTEVAAIKAKTDNLPSDPADASDVAASFVTVNTKLDTIDDFLDTEITAIKNKTDQFVFTVPNKVDASATLTGGGDATLAKQTEILTAIGEISTAQLAAITVESGVIGNFPDTLTIGDSYDTDTGWIKVLITDESNDPITGLGGLLFSEADVSFTAFRPNDSARVYGVCEFVDAGSETYVKLTLTSEETTKGLPEYTYEGRLKFVWDSTSASSDLVDSRQKTYKTTPFKFIANP